MAITGGIIATKDIAPQSAQPLLICQFVFPNGGPVLYVSSVQDDQTNRGAGLPITGRITYGGIQYQCRIVGQNLQAIQVMSSIGIDSVPEITISLANGDGAMWEYEFISGFKGAQLLVYLIFWDQITNTFTNDYRLVFSGICDSANSFVTRVNDDEMDSTVAVRAVSIYNFNRKLLPILPDQIRCPFANAFPATSTERARRRALPYPYNTRLCLYSPDQPSGYGNYASGTTPFTACDGTKSACTQRGMYDKDHLGQTIRNFLGNTYNTPALWRSKSYLEGKTITGINNANLVQYSQHYPEVFGAAWVENPIILTTFGDGNATRWEVAVCVGWIGGNNDDTTIGISKVEVNGILIPRLGSPGSEGLFNWRVVCSGTSQGAFDDSPGFTDTAQKPLGDPHSNVATLDICVYNELANSTSMPTIRVLVGDAQSAIGANGQQIPIYTDAAGNFVGGRSDLAADVLLEVMRRADVDVSHTFDYAAYSKFRSVCGQLINYNHISGQVRQHRRYGISLSLEPTTQYQVGNLLQKLRLACNCLIYIGNSTGKLVLRAKQGIADQQPNPVLGSNFNSSIASYVASDNPLGAPSGIGYAAYYFDESTIVFGSLRITQNSISSSPNLIKCQINDEDYDHIQDSVTVGDATDAVRVQQNVNSSVDIIGLPNSDQALRVVSSYMAELYRGNPRQDSGGTYVVEFDTSINAAHLGMGDIVLFSDILLGVSLQPFRIISVNYTMNAERIKIKAQWHEDIWYCDLYAQVNPYFRVSQGDASGHRTPYQWQPDYAYNQVAEAVYSGLAGLAGSYASFGVARALDYDTAGKLIPAILVKGNAPVNSGSSVPPPLLDRVAGIDFSSGSLPDGHDYYVYASCTDANGNESPLCRFPATAHVNTGSATNSLSVKVLYYPSSAVGVRWYLGFRSDFVSRVPYAVFENSLPSIVTLSGFPQLTGQGPVDTRAKFMTLRVKKLTMPGHAVFGPFIDTRTGDITPNAVTANSITFLSQSELQTNVVNGNIGDHTYDGFLAMCVATADGSDIPFLTLSVASQVGNTLTFFTNGQDLTTLGLDDAYFLILNKLDSISANAGTTAPAALHIANMSPAVASTLIGSYVRVIEFNGADNVPKKIVSTDAAGSLYLESPFHSQITTGSLVVVEDKAWRWSSESKMDFKFQHQQVDLGVDVQNINRGTYFLQATTQDADSVTGPASQYRQPYRIIFWQGDVLPSGFPSTGLNLLDNPNFEIAATLSQDYLVAGWHIAANHPGWHLSRQFGNAYSGNWCLKAQLDGGQVIAAGDQSEIHFQPNKRFACKSGDAFYMSVNRFIVPGPNPFPTGVSVGGGIFLWITYTDGSHEPVFATTETSIDRGWVRTDLKAVIPYNNGKTAVDLYVEVVAIIKNFSGGSFTTRTGDVYLVFDNADLSKAVSLNNQLIGDSLVGVVGQGSIIPTQFLPVTIAENSNTSGQCRIRLTWGSTSLTRSDRSVYVVNSGQAIWNNLAANTTYYFYVYAGANDIQLSNYSVHFGSGDPPATPPSSPSANFSMVANYDGNVALGIVTVHTPSTSGGTGSGGGGGGTCPDGTRTKVYHRDKGPISPLDLEVGDWIRGRDIVSRETVYRRVKMKHTHPSSTWRIINGCPVSPGHPVWIDDKWDLPFRHGLLDTTRGVRVSLTIDAAHHDDHNFSLVNDEGEELLLMHNTPIYPC